MKLKPLAEAQAQLAALVASGQDEPVLITRDGRPAAMLIPVPEESDVEDLALSVSPAFHEILGQARSSLARSEGVSLDEARRRLLEEPA